MASKSVIPLPRIGEIALALAIAAAYRQLAFFDPNLHAADDVAPVEEWFFAFDGSSTLLICALTAWFVVRRSRQFEPGQRGSTSTAVGIVGILAASGLLLWGYAASSFQVLAPSLGILLVSSGLYLGGAAGGRALWMPACFVTLLGTPIPTPLLNHVLFPMQLWTADISSSIIRLLGYSASQSGDLILTPWAVFQVIETCAGLRSTLTLVMAAFVYCELLDHDRRRWAVLLLAAPLIGIATNLVRVLVLVLMRSPESQPDHAIQGIVMTVVGVIVLWGVDVALDRIPLFQQSRAASASNGAPTAPSREPRSTRRVWVLASLMAILSISSPSIPSRHVVPQIKTSMHSIPRHVGDWSTGQNPLVVDPQYMGSVRFSNRTWREYRRGGEAVTLFAGSNDHLRRITGIVSEKTKTLTAGTAIVEETRGSAIGDSKLRTSSSLVLRSRSGATLIAEHWYEHTDGLWIETIRSMLALDRSPWRRETPSRVIQIATQINATTGGEEGARRRVREFSDLVRIELQKIDDAG